jgi:phage terminase large subunit
MPGGSRQLSIWLEKYGWEEFKEFREDLAPALESVHETLLRVKFVNGSTLSFKGADNERSLRGRGLTYLVIDEAAFVEPDIWTRALRPALSDRNGKVLLISTPNGRNWFYDQAAVASLDDMWLYEHWPTWKNPLITEDELKQAAATVSETDFRQEYLAEFITKEGLVYDNFSDENMVESASPSWHDWDIYLGMDFGFANPTAVCFMAVNNLMEQVIQFDELYISRKSIDIIEDMIIDKLKEHNLTPDAVKGVYTDPAGNAAELSSGISPVDSLRMSPYRWKVYNKGTEIAPGIALVRSFIQSANGSRKYYVTNKCRETVRSLSGYTYTKESQRYQTIKEEALKDGLHDHMCDAIRYFFVNCFDQNKWIAEVPEQYNYGIDLQSRARVVMKRCQVCKSSFPSRTPKNQPPHICRKCNGE